MASFTIVSGFFLVADCGKIELTVILGKTVFNVSDDSDIKDRNSRKKRIYGKNYIISVEKGYVVRQEMNDKIFKLVMMEGEKNGWLLPESDVIFDFRNFFKKGLFQCLVDERSNGSILLLSLLENQPDYVFFV